MELKQFYNQLWNESLPKFQAGNFQFDPFLDATTDQRYGVTLLARPTENVKKAVRRTLEEIQAVAPNQYYYPHSDLHLTVLSIISCYSGFSLDHINPSAYKHLIHSALKKFQPFKINFQGLTASPSAILVQGFPEDNQLNQIRNELRKKFRESNLKHSIDQRYSIQTAHLTVIRFKQNLYDPHLFINKIDHLKNRKFGHSYINELELVANDWYQKKDKVKLMKKFNLNSNQ